MIRIAVCDDEQYMLDDLREVIESLKYDVRDTVKADYYKSAEELFLNKDKYYDIFLLDISMDGMSGMDAAKILRKRSETAEIIFITSMVQYAIEGYEVRAFAFMPKPVDKDKYRNKILEAINWHRKQVGNVISLKCGTDTVLVPSGKIFYIDVMNHRLRVVTAKDEFISYTPLKGIEQDLPTGTFFRCHKSFLINFAAVTRLASDCVIMKDGTEIPISKYRKNDLLAAFSRYMEGR